MRLESEHGNVTRIEIEYEDGWMRQVTDRDAQEVMDWIRDCESVMHTRSYSREFPDVNWEEEQQ